MSVMGHIYQLNISNGGVPKLPVSEAFVGRLGLTGDAQRDLEHHGGPDRAVCLYAFEHIVALQGAGHPIAPGTTGENVTITGLDWPSLGPGTRLALGDEVELEITGYAAPCSNIAGSFADGVFTRLSQKKYPGWSRLYARVLRTGAVVLGDTVRVIA